MSKENWDFIDTAKNMVVEYYNRYVSQIMNRCPKIFKKKIKEEDVNVLKHTFADNIEEVSLNTGQNENIIYTVSRDIMTNEIKSYLITTSSKKEGE